MTKITDAQVEVADAAFWAVWTSFADDKKAMLAALKAYERVRDVKQILQPDLPGTYLAEEQAENDTQVEQGLQNLHRKLEEDYPR